ncbi:MAG: hypothetical protein ABSD80_16020 [Caulobacteraceae bacterium]|jgi:hypothetical protein
MLKSALPFLFAALAAGAAFAQQGPSPREACKPDVERLCPNLQPGERPRDCLMQHRDQVSDACKAAVMRARAAHDAAKGAAPNPAPNPN